MFSNASNFVEGVDTVFVIILSVIFFFLIGLTATLVIFIFRYREKKNPVATQIHGNTSLEIVWTIVPLIIVLAMFYFGWVEWKPMYSKAPDDAFNIKVIGRMWKWQFEYPDERRTDTLFIPAGKAVNLELNSLDVIHSLYIPAFRVKQDVVPGTKGRMWFIANSPGEYDLFCAEYCGLEHSYMYSVVKVLPANEFEAWVTDTTKKAPAIPDDPLLAGKQIMDKTGCMACHTLDGSKLVGPSYKGLFGKEEIVVTGGNERTITVDEEYLRKSILDPNADIVKGFNKGLMLSYKDQLSDKEIDMIIEYIKSLD